MKESEKESRAGIPLIAQDDREETLEELSVGAQEKKAITDDIQRGGDFALHEEYINRG